MRWGLLDLRRAFGLERTAVAADYAVARGLAEGQAFGTWLCSKGFGLRPGEWRHRWMHADPFRADTTRTAARRYLRAADRLAPHRRKGPDRACARHGPALVVSV